MRRIAIPVAVVLLIVPAGLVAFGRPGTVAQDASPVAAAGHPLVGTWIINQAGTTPAIATFAGFYTGLRE